MAKRQENCDFSITEDHFPGRDMGLNVNAGAPVICTYRVHPVSCKKNKARPVTHSKQFQRLLGLMAAASSFCTVVHETPAVVAQDQRVFPEEQPLFT